MCADDSLEPGSQIDSYRIEAPVARSGMASIYRATDTARQPHRRPQDSPSRPRSRSHPLRPLQREAGIGEKLNHPKVMRVFGGEKRSRIYMVMEWCDGRLLRHILDEGRIRRTAPSASPSAFSTPSNTSTPTASSTAT
jgi:eukaryotic-like serine/threonine-protein kinase